MNPGSPGVSGLRSSETFAWATRLGLTVSSLSPNSALHYGSPLLIHSHLEALLLRWYFWFLSSPVTLEYQGAWMPCWPTSISSQALQLFVLQASTGSRYFPLYFVLAIRPECSTICSGNFSSLPRSSFSCQPLAEDNSSEGTFVHQVMFWLAGNWCLLCWIPVQMVSATSFST